METRAVSLRLFIDLHLCYGSCLINHPITGVSINKSSVSRTVSTTNIGTVKLQNAAA